jgi:hypothetical protein
MVGSFPMSMMVWVSRDNNGTDQWALSQGKVDGDSFVGGLLLGSIDTYVHGCPECWQFLQHAKELDLERKRDNEADGHCLCQHDRPDALLRRQCGVNDTFAVIDDLASHSRCLIGAIKYNNTAANGFVNGSVAEAHWFNTALTATDVANLVADSVKPEVISGGVAGRTFRDYEADSTYTSIDGTRTMTAIGGVTASGSAHPIARTSRVPVELPQMRH